MQLSLLMDDNHLVAYLEATLNQLAIKHRSKSAIGKGIDITETPLFKSMPPERQGQMLIGVSRCNEARMTGLRPNELKRREQKALEKKLRILKAYFEEGMKPKQICKELKVDTSLVYKVT